MLNIHGKYLDQIKVLFDLMIFRSVMDPMKVVFLGGWTSHYSWKISVFVQTLYENAPLSNFWTGITRSSFYIFLEPSLPCPFNSVLGLGRGNELPNMTISKHFVVHLETCRNVHLRTPDFSTFPCFAFI